MKMQVGNGWRGRDNINYEYGYIPLSTILFKHINKMKE